MIYIPNNVTLSPVYSAPSLEITFDSNLNFSQQVLLFLYHFCYHICDLRLDRYTVDHTTACTSATSLIHSKLDYCNSLQLDLTPTQTKRLQFVLNATARAAIKTPKFHHISPIVTSLHWLKLIERILYEVLSLA
jgi:hypothetical protein